MWTVLLFVNLGALHCTVSPPPPSPTNVAFSAVNLRNVLRWSPGNGTPEDTHFTVQYAIYGDSVEGSKGRRVNWRAVQHCTDIVLSWCDLSNETWDQEQGYYAKVRAIGSRESSNWTWTQRRFDPKSDTTFGPPLVSLETQGNYAIITLKGPLRYQPNNHTQMVSMATLYPQMVYNLSIHNIHSVQTNHFLVVSSPFKYQLMEHATEYCFSAKTKFLSMPVQCKPSAWQCITTPQDPGTVRLQKVVWGIVVPSLCMCVLMVIGYFLRNYLIGKGQKSPYILNNLLGEESRYSEEYNLRSFQPPPLIFPPENLNLIFISVKRDEQGKDTEDAISDLACPEQQPHFTDSPPRYNPQRPEAPSELYDLSIDYGLVGGAPKIRVVGEEEARHRRHDRGEDDNNLNSIFQKSIEEGSYKRRECKIEDGPSAGVYAPQAKSYLSQISTHTCTQTRMPISSQTHLGTEMSTLLQTEAWSQLKTVSPTQSQGSLKSFQGATKGEVDRECQGLCLNKNPQTGLFYVPLNLRGKEVGSREEMDGKVGVRTDGEIDGAFEEGSEGEQAALLSAYVSRNITYIPASHPDLSAFVPNDYGVLSLATAHNIEEDVEEEEDEGSICIHWDPETRKLVLPEMAMEFSREGGSDWSIQGEAGSKDRMEGEEEEKEVNAVKGKLELKNVFVKQGSEEDAEALRDVGRSGETGWEENDILTKWNLVISMDE